MLIHLSSFWGQEDFEDTKGVNRNRKSKDEQKNRKKTNNDLQNITHKTKDRVTRTKLKTVNELRCSGRVSSSCSTSGTHRVTLVTNPVISHEWGKDREVFSTSLWSYDTWIYIYCSCGKVYSIQYYAIMLVGDLWWVFPDILVTPSINTTPKI
jgi:hypothetical protein